MVRVRRTVSSRRETVQALRDLSELHSPKGRARPGPSFLLGQSGLDWRSMKSERVLVFERYAERYDAWFDSHRFAYESELAALRKVWPVASRTMEVGAGTGRFMLPLNISVGVEPAKRAAAIARRRGALVICAFAESLPFRSSVFDAVLMVTTICFLDDPSGAVAEARRVLVPEGRLVLAFVDAGSSVGRDYLTARSDSVFYRVARFYSADDVVRLLATSGFSPERFVQTIFRDPEKLSRADDVREGHGEGAFVVVKARKVRS